MVIPQIIEFKPPEKKSNLKNQTTKKNLINKIKSIITYTGRNKWLPQIPNNKLIAETTCVFFFLLNFTFSS